MQSESIEFFRCRISVRPDSKEHSGIGSFILPQRSGFIKLKELFIKTTNPVIPARHGRGRKMDLWQTKRYLPGRLMPEVDPPFYECDRSGKPLNELVQGATRTERTIVGRREVHLGYG